MKRNMTRLMTMLATGLLTLSLTVACGPSVDDFDAGDDYDAGSFDSASPDPTCADYQGQSCTDTLDECQGELLVFCDNGSTVCNDCASENHHCALWSSDYGHECLAAAGQTCADDFPLNNDNNVGCDPAIGTCSGGTCN